MTTLTHGEQRTEKQKAYDERVMERVKAGIARLQEEHGDGWVDKIDLSKLSLRHGNRCVLGQVYGGYERGLVELLGLPWDVYMAAGSGVYDREAARFGFFIEDDHPEASPEWDALDAAWKDALTPTVTRG